MPVVKAAKPAMILAPQPKAALTAAMPAQDNQVKPSTAPVHLGQTFGVTPNPNATRPATIAAIGNPYGGNAGAGGCAAWRGGLDGHRQRTQVRLECRGGGQSSLGGHSGSDRRPATRELRQGGFGGHSRA